MSNIYIQEPPTSGKVLLKTTVGDIDIELWAREAPKACRNFIQLCMEGYYDGLKFHRLVKGFIVQGGDPNGDGTGGESIYGKPFKDEFHSRLRFTRRGLLGMANAGKNDNGSQFFFTLGPTPELQNKHTLFGKVVGDTLFNMLKLEDGLVDANETPMYQQKILKTEILNNPFDDITPRDLKKPEKSHKSEKKKEKGVKNFGLLSFGSEAEEDEQESTDYVQKTTNKIKSTHDLLDDPKLSKESYKLEKNENKHSDIEDNPIPDQMINDEDLEERAERIRNKLKGNKSDKGKKRKESTDSADDLNYEMDERKATKMKKMEEIKNEIMNLKKEYKNEKKSKEKANKEEVKEKEVKNEIMQGYLLEKEKYSKLKELPKKGASREAHTLQLLSKFKSKLLEAKSSKDEDNDTEKPDDNIDDINSDHWLSHKLEFNEQGAVLAKDAATKEDDWYDVYDPRNPLNKRRRGDKKVDKK